MRKSALFQIAGKLRGTLTDNSFKQVGVQEKASRLTASHNIRSVTNKPNLTPKSNQELIRMGE